MGPVTEERAVADGPKKGSTAGNAAITSLSQAAAMVSGGILAVVVAATLGNNASTDGFFAAFAVYSIFVAFAQSARTTIVARLLEGRSRFTALDHYFGAALFVVVLVVLAFGLLGDPVARLLTGDLPDEARETAKTALLILTPAAALQLFSALGAAMLGALDDFMRAGMSFVVGSIVSIIAFIALRPTLGIDGLPVALLIGSVVSAGVVAQGLLRLGWRPSATSVTEPRHAGRALSVLSISSVSFLIVQIGFIVTLSVGARLGVGTVTVLTYAMMAMSLLQALFVSAVPMVMAAPLARSWDREPESLLPHHEDVFRAGLILVLPAIAAAALVGVDLGRLVLAAFTDAQVTLVVELFLILSVNVIWGLIQSVPYAAVVAIGRYTAIALTTVVVVGVQIGISVYAGSIDDVHLLAAAAPLSTFISAIVVFLLISRRYPRIAIAPLSMILARLGLASGVAFGAPWLVMDAVGLSAANVLALVVGSVLFALLVFRALPEEREIAQRLMSAVPMRRSRVGTA